MLAGVDWPELRFSDGQRVTLRPEAAADESALFDLYASTREEELSQLGWDASTRAHFLRGQFQAQRVGYRGQFPNGQFDILLLDAAPIGRVVVNEAPLELRLVDLVLSPAVRNRGLGTALITALLAKAQQIGSPVRLHVLRHSPARHLYHRLGFRKLGESGFYDEMECRAAPHS